MYIFVHRFLQQHISFCSITFRHLWGRFMIPSSQNMVSFWMMKWSQWFLQASREIPIKRFFVEIEISGNPKVWVWMSMVDVVGYPSQVLTIPAWSAKTCEVWQFSDGGQHPSNWPIPDHFHWLLPLISLAWNNTWLNSMSNFIEGAHNKPSLQSH